MEVCSISKIATWFNTIYNAYEPANKIRFVGKLTDDDVYEAFQVWGYLQFNSGSFIISINYRHRDGTFHWRNDDKTGVTTSFEEAWKKMPAYITDPDHYEESQLRPQ